MVSEVQKAPYSQSNKQVHLNLYHISNNNKGITTNIKTRNHGSWAKVINKKKTSDKAVATGPGISKGKQNKVPKEVESDKNLLGLEMFNIDSETASTGQTSSSNLSSNRQATSIGSYRADTLKSDEDESEDDIFSGRALSQ